MLAGRIAKRFIVFFRLILLIVGFVVVLCVQIDPTFESGLNSTNFVIDCVCMYIRAHTYSTCDDYKIVHVCMPANIANAVDCRMLVYYKSIVIAQQYYAMYCRLDRISM